eukprot:s2505_g7.t1
MDDRNLNKVHMILEGRLQVIAHLQAGCREVKKNIPYFLDKNAGFAEREVIPLTYSTNEWLLATIIRWPFDLVVTWLRNHLESYGLAVSSGRRW